jgi:hypothetical protein
MSTSIGGCVRSLAVRTTPGRSGWRRASHLDRPAPCLYLAGPPQLGKSLLADGLAALWNCKLPAEMAEAISDFNESTGECPIVFTDEGFPPKLDFASFRKMITAHARRVNMKFRAKVTVEGCARFIIAANNEDLVRYQKLGTLSQNDLDAIADRLLVVSCDGAARDVVQTLDTTEAASCEIAEHVLWLAETVALEPPGCRMAARPGGGERLLADVVAGRNAEVLSELRSRMGDADIAKASGVWAVDDREVRVNVSKLFEGMGGRAAHADIRSLCKQLALRPTPEQHKVQGANIKWWVLDRAKLNAMLARLD